jgi:hypothetical protein
MQSKNDFSNTFDLLIFRVIFYEEIYSISLYFPSQLLCEGSETEF